MDLMFKRYFDPYTLMNSYIKVRRFEEFVIKSLNIINKETENHDWWEMWLHKCYDKTYNDFRYGNGGTVNTSGNDANTTQKDCEDIINRLFKK